jgi:hypothetical protein
MVDLRALRKTISETPKDGPCATVSRAWLEEVERDLTQLQLLRMKEKR